MNLDYGKIEDSVNELNNINTGMRKSFDQIKDTIKIINNSWTGDASDYYLKKANEISIDFDEFSRELKACALYLQKISDYYNELDREVQLEINEIISNSKFFN